MSANMSNSLEVRNQPGFSIISFSGFVDAATVEQARPAINAKIPADCANIIISLDKVEFLDSHGIGLFASLLKRAHAHKGQLIFVGATDQPASVLNMVGFNGSLVTYCDSVQKARALLEKENID